MHAADLLTARARLSPEAEALTDIHTGQRLSYAALNARANRAAHLLLQLGVRAGDRVSILAYNGLAHLDLFFGGLKIGAALAPLNWRLTARELAYILRDCAPSVLLVGPEWVDMWRDLQPHAPPLTVVALENAALTAPRYADLLADQPASEPPRPADLHADTPAAILYTSGTTGHPKGAVIPHRQVLWNAINTVISWGLTAADVTPIFTPLFHAGGLFAFLVPVLYAGGRVVLTRAFDVDASLRLIEQEACTVILGVPTLFQMWQNAPGFAQADFSRVRFFISGGAPCPPALMQFWRETKGVAFRQGYGLTEVGVNCFSMTDAEAVTHPGTVGRPIFHSAVMLMNPETLAPAPPGEAGELWISGPHVCAGYWHNPEATSAALVAWDNRVWFRTGDAARCDSDGFYAIVGRYKDMIKSGGENIYAAEVEAVFREHPAVADAALIGLPDAKWGEVGLLVVACRPGHACTPADLLAFAEGRLARYKLPKRVEFLPSLPYSPYGKVIKADLRRQFVETSA